MIVGWMSFGTVYRFSMNAVAFVPSSCNRCYSSKGLTTSATTARNPVHNDISSISKSMNELDGRSFSRGFALSSGAKVDETGTANSTVGETSSRIETLFPGAELLTIELIDHIPLGCTIEESLHEEDDSIFISKLTKEGNAEKAGLRVGDVVVGVTGSFGELTGTINSDVEKIKKLVAAVPEEDPLVIEVARGTRILERHESTLVDLCNLSGESEKDVQDCVVNFLSGGYDYDSEDVVSDEEVACDDEDPECLIDGMMNLWADELPPPPTTSGITDQTKPRSAKAPKPWSNRSSPSGTWVRDPKTGKMRNIDA